MFGATCTAAPVATSSEVATTFAVGTSAASPVPACVRVDGLGGSRSVGETMAEGREAPATLAAFVADATFVQPAGDSGGRGTTLARQVWRGASTPCSRSAEHCTWLDCHAATV